MRPKNLVVFGFTLFTLVLALGEKLVAAPTVSEMRVGKHSTKTRFVMELSQKVDFSTFPLTKPYRFVINLPTVTWSAPCKAMRRQIGLVTRFRCGQFTTKTSRIVLDLAGAAKLAKAFHIPPRDGKKWRIVFDLISTSSSAMQKDSTKAIKEYARKKVPATDSRSSPQPKKENSPNNDARPLIVIDPGHGGVDPGAVNASGVYEKNVVLSIAKVLKKFLQERNKYRVLLTRNTDIFVPLRKRIEFARIKNASLFISLHVDSIKDKKLRGMSVYTLSEKASSKEAALLAEKENKSDLVAGADISSSFPMVPDILLSLAMRTKMNESALFSERLVSELGKYFKLLPKPRREAGFAVLKSPGIPSVLVELGFLSNVNDIRALSNKNYQVGLARSFSKAIDGYFNRLVSSQTN